MDISLRHFDEGDCAFMQQIFESEPIQLISEFNTLKHNGLFFEMFVIDTELGLVGYASLYGVKDDNLAISLGINILAEYQGKGIGSKVCDILFDKAMKLGYIKAIAQARQDNTASLSLIKKKCFVLISESISKTGKSLYNFEKSLNNKKTHNMRLNPEPFEAIKAGLKKIEIRLNDEKRKAVKIGDEIIFTKLDGAEQISVEVLARYEYKTFRELYERFSPTVCGSKYSSIEKRLMETYENYYTKEQELKNGVLGIEIEIIKDCGGT